MEEIEVLRCLVKLSNRNVDLSYVVSLEVSKWDLRGDYCRSTHSCPKSYSASSAVHSWQNQDLHSKWSRLKTKIVFDKLVLDQWICKHRVCSPLKKQTSRCNKIVSKQPKLAISSSSQFRSESRAVRIVPTSIRCEKGKKNASNLKTEGNSENCGNIWVIYARPACFEHLEFLTNLWFLRTIIQSNRRRR